MDKPLQRARKISGALIRELQPALTGVHLFGSAARDEYVPGHSDLNLLLVFDELDRNSLKKTSVLQRKFGGGVVLMCLTKEYILTSLDTFPLELLDMKLNHITLQGEDVLSRLQIVPEHLRLQCERELKAKLSLLRQGLIARGCREKELSALLADHFPALAAILQGIIYLRHEEAPQKRAELYLKAADELGLPQKLLTDLKTLQTKGRLPFNIKTEDLYFDLINVIDQLAREVDIMEHKPQ